MPPNQTLSTEAGELQIEQQRLAALEPDEDGPLHRAMALVHDPFVQWLPRALLRYNEPWDERTALRFDAELQAARERLAAEAAPAGPIPDVLTREMNATLDSVDEMARAITEQQAAFGRWINAQYELSDALARVAVMFPPERHIRRDRWRLRIDVQPSSTVAAATLVANAFGEAGAAIVRERDAGNDPGPLNDMISAAVNATTVTLGNFAVATNRSTRRLVL